MTEYRASVRVADGTLHTSRPLSAPAEVVDLIDRVVFEVAESRGAIDSVELDVAVPGASETPIGDGIAATSSTPLPAAGDEDDEDVEVTA